MLIYIILKNQLQTTI